MGQIVSNFNEIKAFISDQEDNPKSPKCSEISFCSQEMNIEFPLRRQNRNSTWVKVTERKQLHKLNNQTYYCGDLVDGKKEGFGKLYWSNKDYYEGHFHDDSIHGMGKLVKSDLSSYYGNWVYGHISGRGVFRSSDGRIYTGEFSNGIAEGKGQIKFTDGTILKGIWKNGELQE